MNSKQNDNVLDKPVFAWVVTILVIYSVICYTLETLPDLSAETRTFFYYSEIAIVSLFTVEYLYRVYSAPDRIKFIFSFYGLIDLLAILPFYMATVVDLRMLRLMRLLVVARLLKLVRYSAAIERFSKALYTVKEELVIFTLGSLVMLYFAAVGIYHFEHEAQPEVFRSIFDCLWWAAATLTTVGYGDIYPITVGGRIFTFVVLMIGLGLVAIPTGIIASALSGVRREAKSVFNKEYKP